MDDIIFGYCIYDFFLIFCLKNVLHILIPGKFYVMLSRSLSNKSIQ